MTVFQCVQKDVGMCGCSHEYPDISKYYRAYKDILKLK
jgi:hypothetical protein